MRTRTKEERLASRLMGYGLPAEAAKDPRSSELAEVWTYSKAGALYAIGFWGSSAKAAFYYRYRTEAERQEKARTFFKAAAEHAQRVTTMKAERQASPRGLEVGDILRSSWGYDQTNIDYYEVTKLIGKSKVEIREICADSAEDQGWLRGTSVPMPGRFKGEPMVKVAKNGSVRIASYASASKMQPTAEVAGKKLYSPSNWTAYA